MLYPTFGILLALYRGQFHFGEEEVDFMVKHAKRILEFLAIKD